jgi:hypothetical protein
MKEGGGSGLTSAVWPGGTVKTALDMSHPRPRSGIEAANTDTGLARRIESVKMVDMDMEIVKCAVLGLARWK